MKIRNFCIIAHIDHGKSTLADRFLEITNTIDKMKMHDQFLDMHPLERERGITIKMQPVRMKYKSESGEEYLFHLIDTPGHADFGYEVSRALASVEGAILLVDASCGVQAQTLTNLYLAIEQGLTIIPVINKIDLPAVNIDNTRAEIKKLLGCPDQEILLTSGKTGVGVKTILEKIINIIPEHKTTDVKILRALIFDSKFDDYKGIIMYIRIFDGEVKMGDTLKTLATNLNFSAVEVGTFTPLMQKTDKISAGEIGYIATGLKTISSNIVGDTVSLITKNINDVVRLPGYKAIQPLIFVGFFCKDGSDYENLKNAMYKLKLNDASLHFEPENSSYLGFGFRCGFLGMLHLDIIRERLKREYNLDIIVTYPSVAYQIKCNNKESKLVIKNPFDLPHNSTIQYIEEPIVNAKIIAPQNNLGKILELIIEKRGEYKDIQYLFDESNIESASRTVLIQADIPLSTIITDFYDKLKSFTSGYGSLSYQLAEYRKIKVVRLDIVIADEVIEALSSLVLEENVYYIAKNRVKALKDTLRRQQFEIKIQGVVGGKIVASERLASFRKDVTAKLYGGDYTRKMKLLEKQKKGKEKMKNIGAGSVDIPQESFLAVFKI